MKTGKQSSPVEGARAEGSTYFISGLSNSEASYCLLIPRGNVAHPFCAVDLSPHSPEKLLRQSASSKVSLSQNL